MLSYSEFKEFCLEEFKTYFPEGDVKNVTYRKTNIEVDAIQVLENPDSKISERFDLRVLYQEYCNEAEGGNTYAEYDVIHRIAQGYYQEDGTRKYIEETFRTVDKTMLFSSLSFKLINTEMNREYLQNIPHREYLDMSVIYISTMQDGMNAIMNNSIMEVFDITEQELFENAYNNTKSDTQIYEMKDLMQSLLLGGEIQNLLEDDSFIDDGQEMKLFVMTNSEKLFGAGTVLISEHLQFLAEKLNDDLYIIPSSLHECLILPKSSMEAKNVADMIYEVNMFEVDMKDRLSNNVYSFTRGDDSLRMAEYVSDKKIDGTNLQQNQIRKNPPIQGGGSR